VSSYAALSLNFELPTIPSIYVTYYIKKNFFQIKNMICQAATPPTTTATTTPSVRPYFCQITMERPGPFFD